MPFKYRKAGNAYQKIHFLISQPKHMLKLMGKKKLTILHSKFVFMNTEIGNNIHHAGKLYSFFNLQLGRGQYSAQKSVWYGFC